MILESIVNKSPIVKGWSGDQKYCAVTADGTKYLLRVSSIDRLERKRREYEKMSEVSQLDIPMCLPVEFGICDEGVYSIQSWIDGVDAEDAMMAMRPEQQYSYGLDAGRILASSIPFRLRRMLPIGKFDLTLRLIEESLCMKTAS